MAYSFKSSPAYWAVAREQACTLAATLMSELRGALWVGSEVCVWELFPGAELETMLAYVGTLEGVEVMLVAVVGV